MTREEVREWKERIEDSLNRMETCIDFYRATLEEAARAVCHWCRREFPEHNDHDYWHESILCHAPEIHDLIAALDSEGSGSTCHKCGAPTEGGRTVCGRWVCEDRAVEP